MLQNTGKPYPCASVRPSSLTGRSTGAQVKHLECGALVRGNDAPKTMRQTFNVISIGMEVGPEEATFFARSRYILVENGIGVFFRCPIRLGMPRVSVTASTGPADCVGFFDCMIMICYIALDWPAHSPTFGHIILLSTLLRDEAQFIRWYAFSRLSGVMCNLGPHTFIHRSFMDLQGGQCMYFCWNQ